jgi:hypothetical protein
VVRKLADQNSLCVSTINRLHILRHRISYSFIHASVLLSFCSLSLSLSLSLYLPLFSISAGPGCWRERVALPITAGSVTSHEGPIELGSWPLAWWRPAAIMGSRLEVVAGPGGGSSQCGSAPSVVVWWWVVCSCLLARMRSRCESIYIFPINL